MDDYRSYRRDSGPRSSRHNVKASPQASVDDDSDRFSRRSFRERRASSTARSISSRTGDSHRSKSHRMRSDSTQESDREHGTKALVQAKIREKVAAQQHQSSHDESSSDFWKPKAITDGRKPKENETKKVRAAVEKIKEPEPTVAKAPTAVEEKAASDDDSTRVPDGPPPKTPSFEWECEFCTFTNEPDTKICAICCKTPTKAPIQKKAGNEMPPKNDTQTTTATKESAKTETATEPIKGRTKKITRKITFWPGTKSK